MKRRKQGRPVWDLTIWKGTFTGWKVFAWGRDQVLYTPIEFHIKQEVGGRGLWIARAQPGDYEPIWWAFQPEECMWNIEAMFTTKLVNWAAWTDPLLFPKRKMTPMLVGSDGRLID